jgi:anti-anti-sigma factor
VNAGTDEPSPVLTVDTVRTDQAVVVVVAGEVDADTAGPVYIELSAGLGSAPPALVVDLSEVTFFGSAGIALLVEAKQHTEDTGTGLALVAVNRAVLRSLEVAGVASFFDVYPTRSEALSGAQRDGRQA